MLTVCRNCQRCHHPLQVTADYDLSETPGGEDFEFVAQPTPDALAENAAKIFAAAAGKFSIDLPLCAECADRITRLLEEELESKVHQSVVYKKTLAELSADPVARMTQDEFALRMLELDAEEIQAEQELSSLLTIRQGLIARNLKIDEYEQALQSMEDAFWERVSTSELEARSLAEERAGIRSKTENITQQVQRLRATDILNDAFYIDTAGHFGTINGFRMGRLSSEPVEWTEINAAWGQAALLLDTMARAASKHFSFAKFAPVPLGSFSKVTAVDKSQMFDLFGSGDFSLARLFSERRFNHGMVAFLSCTLEFTEHVQSIDRDFVLVYPINGDKIGENAVSIKMGSGDEGLEAWTRACKYLLTDLKQLLAARWPKTGAFAYRAPAVPFSKVE